MKVTKMSEEERALYQEKVDKLLATQSKRVRQEIDGIDTSKLKDVLDTMVQIDNNPNSEKAKRIYS